MKKILLILCGIFIGLNTTYAQVGNSLNFDGVNDHVLMNLPSVFNDITNNDFTIEAWLKPTVGSVLTVFHAQFDNNNYVEVLISSSGEIFYYVKEGGVNKSKQTNTFLPTGQWSHVAYTWDASLKELNVFTNGILETNTANGGTTANSLDNKLILGQITGTGLFYKGNIDEFRIWNILRTQTEISSNLNNELTLPQTNLMAYYKFNQGVAGGVNSGVTTLNDALNVYNGILTNFALSGTSSNWVDGTVLSVNDFNTNTSVKIYPNPFNDRVNIDINLDSKIEVYNILGKLVTSKKIDRGNSQLDMNQYTTGVYIVKIENENGSIYKKIIKE